MSESDGPNKCLVEKGSIPLQIMDWIMLIGMMGIGIFIMIDGIYSIANPSA